MQNTIHQLLEDLGNTFAGHIKVANDNTAAAQAELAQIKSGLRLLITEPSPTSVRLPESASIVGEEAQAAPEPPRNSTIPGNAFVAVLGTEWATAAEIRKALLGDGYSIAEGTTYNRMRKLATDHPKLVEATTKPERWRLKNSRPTKAGKLAVLGTANSTTLKDCARTAQRANVADKHENSPSVYLPQLHHGDCLDVMATIADGSVDLILTDPPYGTTRCEGDVRLPLDHLWEHYRRILKPTGAVVCFASQPFSTDLISSNRDWFKYDLVWEKTVPSGFLHAANKPMKSHEDILVFSPGTTIHASRSKRRMTYNPQGVVSAGTKKVKDQGSIRYMGGGALHARGKEYAALSNCPRSILRFAKDAEHLHPFQKPLDLLKYLIKTYSNPGEVVLDITMGSGSTCVAAMQTGRKSVGIEQNKEWFEIAEQRIAAEIKPSASNDNASGSPAAFGKSSVIEPAVASRSLTLYQGDCLEVMRTMPSGSVDLIFTSPPYNLGVSSGGRMKNSIGTGRWKNAALANGYASYDDARESAEYIEWQKEVLRECWRLLSPTGAIFYQHKPRGQNKVLQTPLDLNPGLPVRQIIIWNRNNGFNFNSSYFLSTHEWIVVFAKPGFQLTDEGKRLKDVWTIKPERNNPHPAPFPVELPLTAIQATSAKVILDPFVGSGTTGVAAMRCGREFIGIELDAGYLAGAHERVEAERLRLAA